MVDAVPALPQRLVWSVSALMQAVGDALSARFATCVVEGEVGGFTRAASGHCYFSLKDEAGGAALVRCAMFRRAAGLLAFAPRDGQRVQLRARVAVYEPRGELQLVVESMRLAGAGALYEEFLRLRAALAAQGLFEPAHKRPIVAMPRAVGVVTSLDAAALRDVATTFARRAPHVRVVVYPSPVQGAQAPAALCQALALAARRAEVDTVILCRGGGSLEDLWAFNDERVVRAIAASPIPVVCGVGHETDVTLADLAADLRAPTPTAAAELAALAADDARDALDGIAARLQRRVAVSLQTQAQRLDRAALRLARPGQGVHRHAQRLGLLAQRLLSARAHAIERRGQVLPPLAARLLRARTTALASRAQRLLALEQRLGALDPRRVLARGYAWLADAQGAAVVSVQRLAPGAAVHAVLADGDATLQVLAVAPAQRVRPG